MAGILLTACGAAPVQAFESIAQPTELRPPDGETPILYPPEASNGEASVVVLIDEVPMSVAWTQLTAIAGDVGGRVTGSSTGTSTYDGERYEYAVVVLEIPEFAFSDFFSFTSELGRELAFDYSTYPATEFGSITVVVTLTDLAEPFVGTGSGPVPGRIDRALDTAGDVLLTVLSILIVGGAVLLPIALLAGVGYVVWKKVRPEPVVDGSAEASTQEPLIDV